VPSSEQQNLLYKQLTAGFAIAPSRRKDDVWRRIVGNGQIVEVGNQQTVLRVNFAERLSPPALAIIARRDSGVKLIGKGPEHSTWKGGAIHVTAANVATVRQLIELETGQKGTPEVGRTVALEAPSPAGPRAVEATTAATWHLRPGETILRTALHDRYGGSRQGGTIPSRSTPNIFLFLDKKIGAAHGYYDGWAGERFYYTGHGQKGDQELRRANGAVAAHAATGKALRVFRGVSGQVTYLGEFRLDEQTPWFQMDAPEIGTDATRQVIVFRLIPVGHVIREARDDIELPEGIAPAEIDAVVSGTARGPVFTEVPVEQQHAEEMEVSHPTTSHTATRREQTLVLEYKQALEAAGREIVRFRVLPEGEARELVSDVWDKSRNNLVEAKGTGMRGEIRMAIGQLYDYRRFLNPSPACAVLLPAKPRPDVEALLTSAGIAAVWKSGDSFADNADGRFA
jgi:hypothetical protein